MSDFTQVFRDDFNGSSLDTGIWRAQYSGQYGNGMFRWDPSQLEVGGGVLTIATEREGGSWVSGGLSTIPDGQTYGRYEFRARFDEAQGTPGVVLLWPSSNQWTDEVDIIETHRADRDGFAFTNHGTPNVTNYVWSDLTRWADYRLDWTPGKLELFIDGNSVSTITTDVPSQQMSFGMQGQVMAAWETWFGGAPDWTTPNRVEMEFDWVKVSAWTPGRGEADGGWQAPAAPEPTWQDDTWSDWQPASPVVTRDGWGEAEWLEAARTYVANDGSWEGSWRNQVAAGQISLEDVAVRLQQGQGQWDFWN